MAKKKKKTKASLLVAEAVAAVNSTEELCLVGNDEVIETPCNLSDSFSSKRMHAVEFMTANLTFSADKSSSLHVKPRVILTAEDALRLNLRFDDNVFIAFLNDFWDEGFSNSSNIGRKIKSLLVVPVGILGESVNVSERSSPMRRRNEMSRVLPSGTIQLPSASALGMFESDTKVDVDLTVQSPISPLSTASAPKSSNSHLRVSPSSKVVTNGPENNSRRLVHVIACKSKLGRCLLRRLSFECSKLLVEFVDVNPKVIESNEVYPTNESLLSRYLPSSVRILERLIHAHVVGSFVQRGQVLRVSIAGKLCLFRVVELFSSSDKTDSATTSTETLTGDGYKIENDFSNMSLNDDEKYIAQESMTLVDNLLCSGIQLHQVCRSTSVSLFFENRDLEKSLVQNVSSRCKQFVAGLSSTLQEVRSRMLIPLTYPDFFTKRGLRVPRGLLLHGPSGIGKTAMAMQLSNEICAENNLWNCDVRYVHCASLQSKSSVVGNAESALTRLFQTVNQKSVLIILDDVHLICSRRGSGSSGTDRLAATLLALLDGIEINGGRCAEADGIASQAIVFVLAITTNPSLLDAALRRPGRLDSEVEIPLPEELSTRADILQYHLNEFDIPVAENLVGQKVWLELAKLAKGFNGADCMLAAKEAVRLTLLEAAESDLVLRQDHLVSAIRSIKPSAIKSITVEIPQVLWSSIGGMDTVKHELREAIELPLTHSEYFHDLRIPPPRGILLYGPPGCSKTLMARALATDGNMNFLAVKGPELLSKWLGESERALSSLFRRARMASPAIIFFDEIDAIGASRGSSDSASSDRLLSQLLTELDGINHTGSAAANNSKKQHRIVVVGATNRPDLLDTALIRPGRIDKMIYVGPPDAASRAQILQLSLQNVKCGKDIDVSLLASDAYSAGFSGAEMVAISRDAALFALEEFCEAGIMRAYVENNDSMPTIEMRHLLAAMQQMRRQITPEMIEFYTSYRERYLQKRHF